MTPIEIFYHLYIPGDQRCGLWSLFLDGHLSQLKRHGLLDVANFNLAITMPKYWTNVDGLTLTGTFEDKIREYVSLRYPKIKIVEIRDLSDPNVYEGNTLKLLQQRAHEVDTQFLYLHSKGITNFSPVATVTNWKEILDYFMLEQWTKNVALLQECDVVGVRDAISSDLVLSGNFWWSNSQHIRTLPDPLDTELYFEPLSHTYRYAFERWIMYKANYRYAVDTKTNHYVDYCFLENLI